MVALLTRSSLASAACGLLLCSVSAMQDTTHEVKGEANFMEEGAATMKKADSEEQPQQQQQQPVCAGLDPAASTSSSKVVQVVRSQQAPMESPSNETAASHPPPPPPNYHGYTNFGVPDSDAWFNTWFTDPKIWAEIGIKFRQGEMIKITEAMRPDVAEALWQDLVHHKNWVSEARNHDNMQFKRHNMNCSIQDYHDCPKVLSAFHSYLQRSIDRWSQLPLAQLHMWPAWPMATWYRPGDHIAAHDDMTTSAEQGTRALAFILSMTKNWPSKFGGQLGWFSKSTGRYMQHPPEFNTLYLFEPSAVSIHTVSPVVDAAPDPINDPQSDYTVRRLTISGWFTSHDRYYMARINEKYSWMPNYISEKMPPEYRAESDLGAVNILAKEGIFPLQPDAPNAAADGAASFTSKPDGHRDNPGTPSEIMPEL